MRSLALFCAALWLLLNPSVGRALPAPSSQTSCLKPDQQLSEPDGAARNIPWRLVARSNAIVRARLNIPEDAMLALRGRENKYASIGLTVSAKLKNDRLLGDFIQLKAYAAPLAGAPNAATLAALKDKEAIFFLAHPYDASTDAYYFAGNTRGALLSANPEPEDAVRREVEEQLRLARTISAYLARNTPAHDEEVADLIEVAVLPLTSASAMGKLFELGCDAVPALVRHMDDRRLLPGRLVSLSCFGTGCFEAQTNYRPIAVVDLLAIVLDRITHESLGDIYNGGSEEQRRRTIEAWKVWLGRSLGL
jgi:hypothetical protein